MHLRQAGDTAENKEVLPDSNSLFASLLHTGAWARFFHCLFLQRTAFTSVLLDHVPSDAGKLWGFHAGDLVGQQLDYWKDLRSWTVGRIWEPSPPLPWQELFHLFSSLFPRWPRGVRTIPCLLRLTLSWQHFTHRMGGLQYSRSHMCVTHCRDPMSEGHPQCPVLISPAQLL